MSAVEDFETINRVINEQGRPAYEGDYFPIDFNSDGVLELPGAEIGTIYEPSGELIRLPGVTSGLFACRAAIIVPEHADRFTWRRQESYGPDFPAEAPRPITRIELSLRHKGTSDDHGNAPAGKHTATYNFLPTDGQALDRYSQDLTAYEQHEAEQRHENLAQIRQEPDEPFVQRKATLRAPELPIVRAEYDFKPQQTADQPGEDYDPDNPDKATLMKRMQSFSDLDALKVMMGAVQLKHSHLRMLSHENHGSLTPAALHAFAEWISS